MGLFFSKPANRRRRRLIRPRDTSWIEGASPKASTADLPSSRGGRTVASPKDQVHQLNAQIGAIETFLAKHHRAEAERLRMRNENILPPVDRSRHKAARKSLTMAARRKEHAERSRTSFRFLFLFSVACALLWWLFVGGV